VISKIVDIIGDEKQLLSQGGIRSLSIYDSEYGTLDNYWRGSVWLPINYMVLRACRLFYWQEERIREVYGRVRGKLIDSVY
jgi:mannosyl-oligosaccharide glucosidase